MKKETLKILKRTSRKRIPLSFLKGKIMPSRKRKLLDKALKKVSLEDIQKA